MNFDKKLKDKKKAYFLKSTANVMQTKSFFDRHYITTIFANLFSYTLSAISVLLGVTAVFSLFKMFFGINEGLLGIFDTRPLLAYCLVFAALAFLTFIEYAKHHFHTEALTEKYRDTDDRGRLETRIALIAQFLSLALSVWGGVIVANELAGTEKAATLAAIQSEYEPKIAKASSDKISYENAKKWRGKISDENTPELNRLSAIETDLQAAYLAAKKEAGVSSFIATDAKATFNMAALLGGSQILVEFLLYACLYWIVYFKARVYDEEGKAEATTPIQEINAKYFTNQNPTSNQKRTEAKRFANRVRIEKQANTERTHKPTHTYENFVAQQERPTHTYTHTKELIDLSAEKKRVRLYAKRIQEQYTDTRFERLKQDIKTLATHGIRVDIYEGKVNGFFETLPLESIVAVTFDDGLMVKYEL